MKRLPIILLLTMLLMKTGFSSDPLNLGIKIGSGSSTLSTNIDDIMNMNINEFPVNNYHYGIFARASVGKLYLQPEIYFNTKGGEISEIPTSGYDVINGTSHINFSTVDVPVLIGLKLVDRELLNLRAFGGPMFSHIVSKKFSDNFTNLEYSDFKERYNGWQFGVGIDIWFVTVDARIEGTNNILNDNVAINAKNRVFLLSAGIKLF